MIRGTLMALLLAALFLAVPARAQIILPNPPQIYTFEGVLAAIYDGQITVVNEANYVLNVQLTPEQKLTPDYIVGNRVWLELEFKGYNVFHLRRIVKIEPQGEQGEKPAR